MTEHQHALPLLSKLPEALSLKLALKGQCEVNAVLIGNQINLKALTHHNMPRKEPVLTQLTEDSLAIIFHYGAIVFFNATTATTVELITRCQPFVDQLFSSPETEQFTIIFKPDDPEGIVQNKISVKKLTKSHLDLIGDALAKSLILDYHENRIGHLFEKIDPIAKSLKEKGKLGFRTHDMLKHIGASLIIRQEVIGKIEIAEKPLLLWEDSTLEPLYNQLVEDLEIVEREHTLTTKIEHISNTAQISLDVLQQHHSHRLEVYIIILIVIEIFLEVYDLFFKHFF